MKKTLFSLALVFLFFRVTEIAHAQVSLPFYDGFNYSAGNLGGNGSWTTSASQVQVHAASLSYAGLQTSVGNDVTIIPTSSSARTYLNFAAQTSGTTYFSFLVKINTAPSAQRLVAYVFNSTSSSSSPTLGFFVTTGGQLAVGVSTGTPQWTSTGLTSGSTNLVVVAYTFGSSGDSAQIWINPTSLGGSAPTATGSITSTTHSSSFSYFHLNSVSAGTGGGSYEMDELRIGSTYADVTPAGAAPTPTPASGLSVKQARKTGQNFAMTGAGGTPNGRFEIFSASDLTLPAEQWNLSGSGTFDAAGFFNPA